MKILIDARSMGSKPSGIGMYIYNFAKELVKEKDVEIILASDIAVSTEIGHMNRMGAKVETYGKKVKKNLGLLGYFKYLQKLIDKWKPDVFWEGNTVVPIKITNPYGKFVVTVHDLFPITMPQYYGTLYEYYFRYGLSITLKYVDLILYDSCETKNEMERIFPKVIKKDSFISYVIVDKYVTDNLIDGDYFLYVGNLEKRKGTDLLLDGYKSYLRYGGTKKLKLAGKIREQAIQQKIDEMIDEIESVEYLGYLTEEEKQKVYSECSAFLFPSKAEGFGMPVIEAMNYGKPIIASNLSIFKELLENSVNYFELTEQNEKDVEALARKMLHYQKPDLDVYLKITEKYTGTKLSERVYRCFDKIIDK